MLETHLFNSVTATAATITTTTTTTTTTTVVGRHVQSADRRSLVSLN